MTVRPIERESRDDVLRREDMILSVVPQRQFDRVLHVDCGTPGLSARLPGGRVVVLPMGANGGGVPDAYENLRVTSDCRPIETVCKETFGVFDLIVVTGGSENPALNRAWPLAWLALASILKPGAIVIHDQLWGGRPLSLPARRIDRTVYASGDGIRLLELYAP